MSGNKGPKGIKWPNNKLKKMPKIELYYLLTNWPGIKKSKTKTTKSALNEIRVTYLCVNEPSKKSK